MKLVLTTVMVACLVARINCRLFPTSDQFQCFGDFRDDNPTNQDVQTIDNICIQLSNPCTSGTCVDAFDSLWKRCDFDNFRACEFLKVSYLASLRIS